MPAKANDHLKKNVEKHLQAKPVKKFPDTRSQLRFVILMAGCAFLAEVFVMIILSFLPSFPTWLEALFDATLMIILLFPMLLFFAYRPYARQIKTLVQAEKGLKKKRDHLEELVAERTYEFSVANKKLHQEVVERRLTEAALRDRTIDLDERIRQLQCLYAISKLMEQPHISLDEVIQRTINLIPSAWMHPENICSRVVLNDNEFQTENFKETIWRQVSDITVKGERAGTLMVCFLEEKPTSTNGNILKQEKKLLNAVAVHLGKIFHLKRTEVALQNALEESWKPETEIAALLEGARAVLKHREFNRSAKIIFDQCKNLIGANAGYVALLSKDGKENEVVFLDCGGLSCSVDPSLPMPIRGFRKEVYRNGEGLYHNDFSNSEWNDLLPEGHVGFENILFAPLKMDEKVVGLIGLANKPEGFSKKDVQLATAFGELATVALFNSRTLESLETSENRFRSVVETASDAIIAVDSDSNIIFWNQGAETIFGYPAEEVCGKSIERIMPKRFRSAHRCAINHVVSTGKSTLFGKTLKMAGLRSDGSEFPLELTLANWKTKEGLFFTAIIRDISQRIRAEEALRASEENFKRTFDQSPIAAAIISLDYRYRRVNKQLCRITGYSEAELLSLSFQDITHPDDLDGNLENARRLVSGEIEHYQADKRYIRKDGRLIWVRLAVRMMKDASNQPLYFLPMLEDITWRKQAEKKIQVSYNFLRIADRNTAMEPFLDECVKEIKSLTDCPVVGMWIVDEGGRISCQINAGINENFYESASRSSLHSYQCACINTIQENADDEGPGYTPAGSFYTNSVTRFLSSLPQEEKRRIGVECRMFGYESVALVPIRSGERILGLIHVADPHENKVPLEMIELFEGAAMQLAPAIQRVRAEEALKESHQKLEKAVKARTNELIVANQNLIAEIEERKCVENRLSQSKTMLQAVFDGISDRLILVDKDMKIKMMNRVAAEYHGIKEYTQAIGKFCYQVNENQNLCEDCEIPAAVLNGQNITVERRCSRNPERLEQVVIYPLKNGDKAADAIVRVTDITEQKQFENQLIQSEKLASLGVLVSSIAHEINNPNSFVTFNLPILKEYLQELMPIVDGYARKHPDFNLFNMHYPEFRKDLFKLLDNIEHGSGRISAFVSNLRAFSQSNTNKSKEWVDLNSVVEKVMAICRSKLKRSIKSFQQYIQKNLSLVYTKPFALEQVLINLLVNAAQAADKKDSWVKLNVTVSDHWQDHLIIKVSDNGCGMDEKTKRSMFDPFFTTKSPPEGTGLGLYVCHNLISDLGGRITVESEPGQGSTFAVILPNKERRLKPRVGVS